MAVVFISPKKRQKMFFLGITVAFLLLLFIISLGVFLAKPAEVQQTLVFNKPKVNIDMALFDFKQFKDLNLFAGMKIQFSYTASTKDGKKQSGFISALSNAEAIKELQRVGLTRVSVKEVEIGRNNPFIPYSGTTYADTSNNSDNSNNSNNSSSGSGLDQNNNSGNSDNSGNSGDSFVDDSGNSDDGGGYDASAH